MTTADVGLAVGGTSEFVDEDGADEMRWEPPDGDGTIVVFTHTFDQGPAPSPM